MMSAYESGFYNILKSSLWGTPAEVPQGFNEWGKGEGNISRTSRRS